MEERKSLLIKAVNIIYYYYAHCKSTLNLTPRVFLSTIFQPMRSVDGRKEEPFD